MWHEVALFFPPFCSSLIHPPVHPFSVCHRGYFNCSYSPCPAVCTVYSDRHYHTFDGLEYDYHSDCQVYLLKVSSLSLCFLVCIRRTNKGVNDIICFQWKMHGFTETPVRLSESDCARLCQRSLCHWLHEYKGILKISQPTLISIWERRSKLVSNLRVCVLIRAD